MTGTQRAVLLSLFSALPLVVAKPLRQSIWQPDWLRKGIGHVW